MGEGYGGKIFRDSSTSYAIIPFFRLFTSKNDGSREEEKTRLMNKKKKKVAERTRLMTVPSSVPTTAALKLS